MFRYLVYSLILVPSLAFAGDSLVIKQVNPGDIEFTSKTAKELQKSGDGVKEENIEKTDINQNIPSDKLAVPERERANVIINKQTDGKNKENINNNVVKKDDTVYLLKEEKKNIKHKRLKKSKKKTDEETGLDK